MGGSHLNDHCFMLLEEIFHLALIGATVLCSLVAGFLFAFAVVVMPGLRRLDDRAFITAFQRIDGVIQNNQPLFLLVWVGSGVVLAGAVVVGIGHLAGVERLLLVLTALGYFLGVQWITFRIHLPLNNDLQTVRVDSLTAAEQHTARHHFEPRWTRWNAIRTIAATLVSGLLVVLLSTT